MKREELRYIGDFCLEQLGDRLFLGGRARTSERTILVMTILRCLLDIQVEATFEEAGLQSLDVRARDILLGVLCAVSKAMSLNGNHLC